MTPNLNLKNLLIKYAYGIPKCELHLHLEGTLEPEMMIELAKKNNIEIAYKSVIDAIKAYKFQNLQEFLDLYFECTKVITQESDFFNITLAYLKKAHENCVRHAEIYFEPQAHAKKGIKLVSLVKVLCRAQKEAELLWGITSCLIMTFLRHLPIEEHMKLLEEAKPFVSLINCVGLASYEVDFPPSLFKNLFTAAKSMGFKLVAHAGEEGSSQSIVDTLDLLGVSRIDHGVQCFNNKNLIKRLIEENIPLNICPISNEKLGVMSISKHPLLLRKTTSFDRSDIINEEIPVNLIDQGLKITINSDDPGFFGSYINENFKACIEADLGWDFATIKTLAKNSVEASFTSTKRKKEIIDEIEKYDAQFGSKYLVM